MAIREVLAVPFEMMRAADGHPIAVGTTDGDQVVLRIHSATPAPDLTWPACHVLAAPMDLVRAATGDVAAGLTTDGEPMFLYRPELDMETVTVDVAGLDDYQRMGKVMELIHEVAPHDTACWLGRAWKAEIPSSTPVWTTQG